MIAAKPLARIPSPCLSLAMVPAMVLAAALLAATLLVPAPALAHRVNIFGYVEGSHMETESRFSSSNPVRNGLVEVVDTASGARFLEGRTDDQGRFRFPLTREMQAAPRGLTLIIKAGEGHQNDFAIEPGELASVVLPEDGATPAPAAKPAPAPAAAPSPTPAAEAPVVEPAPTAEDAPAPVAGDTSAPIAESAPAQATGAASAAEGSPAPVPAAASAPVPADALRQAVREEVGQAVREAMGQVLAGQKEARAGLEAAIAAAVDASLERRLAPIRRQLAEQAQQGPGLAEIVGGIGWILGLVGIAAYCRRRP